MDAMQCFTTNTYCSSGAWATLFNCVDAMDIIIWSLHQIDAINRYPNKDDALNVKFTKVNGVKHKSLIQNER